jgi:predicted nucleotidyltransferase component of viral defense system
MKLKLADKLKKKIHKDIALLQDMLIDVIYEVFPDAVLHGGTAIWRCYKGARFSDDIDVYLDKNDLRNADLFKARLSQRKLGLRKFKVTENAIYAKIIFNNIEVKFEASFLAKKGRSAIIKPYETIDGNYLNIFTFSAEDLIKEKADAYLSRLLIRDLYDIFVLLGSVENGQEIKDSLKKLLAGYKKPKDESILKTLVFIGAVPSLEQILAAIRKWAR